MKKINWFKLVLIPIGILIVVDLIVGLYANLVCKDFVINYPWGQWIVRNYCDVAP